jgi:UV DNA damage endonuclease
VPLAPGACVPSLTRLQRRRVPLCHSAHTTPGVLHVEFGYACLSVMVQDCSPAKTVTLKRLESITGDRDRFNLCAAVARANLKNTRRLIFHNAAHGLRLYRITPQLVPLATHPRAAAWDWESELAPDFAEVGREMRRFGMRISSHPGQYTVLSSPDPKVVAAARADLEYHAKLHKLLDHGSVGRIVLHVGGAQGGKEAGLERFEQSLRLVSDAVRRRLALENDDTIYGTGDVLSLCRRVRLPMVFDLHHHMLNPAGAELREVLPDIFATWPPEERPKIHVSSPKSAGQPKAHADFVVAEPFREFLTLCEQVGARPIDVMVEAKMKDAAALKLAGDLGIQLHPLKGRESNRAADRGSTGTAGATVG